MAFIYPSNITVLEFLYVRRISIKYKKITSLTKQLECEGRNKFISHTRCKAGFVLRIYLFHYFSDHV